MKIDDAWLNSDAQILGRKKETAHKNGLLWEIALPNGEIFGAVVAKSDFSTATQFCELVRNEWSDIQAEKEAKALRKKSSRHDDSSGNVETGSEVVPDKPPVPASSEVVEIPRLSREQVAKDLGSIRERIELLRKRLAEAEESEKEYAAVYDILTGDKIN